MGNGIYFGTCRICILEKYISVVFCLGEGYHIYADCKANIPFTMIASVFDYPERIRTVRDLIKLCGFLQEGTEEIMMYKDEVEFLQEITGKSRGMV